MERKLKKEFGIETRKRRRRRRWAASILTVATVATAISGVATAWGQISTATEKQGAGSLLDATQPNGRFSGERYDGAIKPSAKSENSRFSNGAVRGSAGNVVGVDASREGGRFSGTSEFRSKQNFELFSWRNEILRTKKALNRAESALAGGLRKQNEPRLTTAKEPKPIPYSEWRRGVRYGRTPEEVEAARQAELAAARTNASPNDARGTEDSAIPTDGGFDPATIWMRGRAPIRDLTGTAFGWTALDDAFGGVWGAGERGGDGGGWVELDGRVRSEFAGASLAPSGTAFAPIPELAPVSRSPEEKRRSYQEYLTTRLLQTPAVNPLSPISVEFRDGVATVSGIVPTPSAREAAGSVLLAEPDVRRVVNRLTCVRSDDDGPGAIVPVAPIPGSVPAANSASEGSVPATAPNVPAVPNVPVAPKAPVAPNVPNAPGAPVPSIPILPDVGSAPPVSGF